MMERIAREQDAHDRQAYGTMLDGARAHPAEWAWYAAWAIMLRDGTLIGDACFKGAPQEGEAEIGYGLDARYRGLGYATEAVCALCEWAFAESNELYFLMGETDADNAASQNVLKKNGFVPAGEGEEGPRFERERPKSAWSAVYIGVGMCLGVAVGTASNNLAMGIAIGSSMGVALGVALDRKDQRKRDALRAARAKKEPTNQPPTDE